MSRKIVRSATMAMVAAALVLALGGGGEAANALNPAPNFTLTLLDGKALSLADLKGKPVLVNFWQAG